jgi:hypothetical protein
MIARVNYSSSYSKIRHEKINTLDELLNFAKTEGENDFNFKLIICPNQNEDEIGKYDFQIEIYDDYRE